MNGAITAERIGGSAIIDVRDGKLDIDHVDGDVTVKQSGSGEVQVSNVKGKVNRNR